MMNLPKNYQGIISKKQQLTKRVFLIGVELLEPKTLDFKPGQFMMFLIDENTRRAYSIASSPSLGKEVNGKPGKLELLIDVEPGGPASKYFIDVTRGTKVSFLAPYGVFSLKETGNEIVFLAGSTGLAPFRAMIGEYYQSQKSKDKSQKLYLFLGVHGVSDQFLVEEFRELEKREPTFKFFSVVSELVNKPGEHGSLTKVLYGQINNLSGKDYYLCGAPSLVQGTREQLLKHGVKTENIFFEKY